MSKFIADQKRFTHMYLIFKWAWVFVPRKDHIGILEQLMPDHVAQGVVLLVQGEYRRVGDLGTCHTLQSRVTCHEAQPWCPAPALSSSLRRTEGRTRMLAERS